MFNNYEKYYNNYLHYLTVGNVITNITTYTDGFCVNEAVIPNVYETTLPFKFCLGINKENKLVLYVHASLGVQKSLENNDFFLLLVFSLSCSINSLLSRSI